MHNGTPTEYNMSAAIWDWGESIPIVRQRMTYNPKLFLSPSKTDVFL